jgi:hypothetical protein
MMGRPAVTHAMVLLTAMTARAQAPCPRFSTHPR